MDGWVNLNLTFLNPNKICLHCHSKWELLSLPSPLEGPTKAHMFLRFPLDQFSFVYATAVPDVVFFFQLFASSFNFKSFCEFLAHQDLCFWSQVSPLMPFLISWVEGHLQMDKLPLFSPPHQASPSSITSLTPLPFL